MEPVDRVLAATESVKIGAFRCPIDYPRFRDTGPIENHVVVFPRSATRIRHAGGRWFTADPGIVTIYNRDQEYTRAPISRDGDRCDWFAVAPHIALEIARSIDPRAEDHPERPFSLQFTRSDMALYLRQRALFVRLERGLVDPLELEQEVIDVVACALKGAYGSAVLLLDARRRAEAAHRELADAARAELAHDVAAPTSVTLLARHLGVSPYHGCRVFRAQTGNTLHRYRLELRMRVALERLSEPGMGLSQVAHELGFVSHSHFTAVMREHLGATPSAVRGTLRHAQGLPRPM
jgi:AraC family transcriptional regulator